MRRTSLLGILMVVGTSASVSLATGALAQDRVGLRPAGATTASDVLVRASPTRRRTELLSRDVAMRLDEARRGRDIVRVHCLDETLSEVGALLRMQDARISELRGALESRASVRRDRYQSMVAIWDRRTHDLRRQADACVGEASSETVTTTVETTTEGSVPDVDLREIDPWNAAIVLRSRP